MVMKLLLLFLGVLASASALPQGTHEAPSLPPGAADLASASLDPSRPLSTDLDLFPLSLLPDDTSTTQALADETDRPCPRFSIQGVVVTDTKRTRYVTPFQLACNFDFSGNDVSHPVETAYGARSCAVMCHNTPGCHVSVFDPQPGLGGAAAGGTCYFKSRMGNPGMSDNRTDLVKREDEIPEGALTTVENLPEGGGTLERQLSESVAEKVAAFIEKNPGYALTWIPSTDDESTSVVDEVAKETEPPSKEMSQQIGIESFDDDFEDGDDIPLPESGSSEEALEQTIVKTIILTTSVDFTVVFTRAETAASMASSFTSVVPPATVTRSHEGVDLHTDLPYGNASPSPVVYSVNTTVPDVTETYTTPATSLPTVTVFVPANAFAHGLPAPKAVECKPGLQRNGERVDCEKYPLVVLEYGVMQDVDVLPPSSPSLTAETPPSVTEAHIDHEVTSVGTLESVTTLAPTLYSGRKSSQAPQVDVQSQPVSAQHAFSSGTPESVGLPGASGPQVSASNIGTPGHADPSGPTSPPELPGLPGPVIPEVSAAPPPPPPSAAPEVQPGAAHSSESSSTVSTAHTVLDVITVTSTITNPPTTTSTTTATLEPTYEQSKAWTVPGLELASGTVLSGAPKPSATFSHYEYFEGGAVNVSPVSSGFVLLVGLVAGLLVVG